MSDSMVSAMLINIQQNEVYQSAACRVMYSGSDSITEGASVT